MDIVQLLDLKKKIEKLENNIKDLIHDREEKNSEAEEIKDKNSNFYKTSIQEANNIQKQIDGLSEQMKGLKKKFDETLKIEKEKELKKLEEKKVRLDEIGLIKKEDREVKIKELKTKRTRLLKDINNKRIFITEISKKIDEQHITNPKDVLMQTRNMTKKAYKAKEEELKELEDNLKYLSIIDPRKAFIKTEEQIAKINRLNYNNLEKFRNEVNIEFANDQDSKNNQYTPNGDDSHKDTGDIGRETVPEIVDVNFTVNETNAATNDQDSKNNQYTPNGDDSHKDTGDIGRETVPEIVDVNFTVNETNAATNDQDIQNMANDLENFMEEIKNSCLTKSLTDLQLMKHQSYTKAFKEMESEVDEFFNNNKELLEGKDIKNVDKIMPHMSNDAIMLLKSRIRKEYRTNDNSIQEKKSFLSKIKSVFSREDKKTNALAKQSKFRKIFNKIKNRFRNNENDERSYNTTGTNTKDFGKKSFGEQLIEKYGRSGTKKRKETKQRDIPDVKDKGNSKGIERD